jgi:hypothetical protein
MKLIQQRSDILDPKPVEQGFMVGKYEDPLCYAAVPIIGSDTQLAIIHQGRCIKECRNRQSAINFIERHRKGKSVAKLPIK